MTVSKQTLLILITILGISCAARIPVKPGVKTTFEEIPGATHESAVDQNNTYTAVLDIVKKINNEIPDQGKTAIVSVVNDAKNDIVADLIYETAKTESKNVVKISHDNIDTSDKNIANRVEVYVREVGINESITEIPKSQILVAQLNSGNLGGCSPTAAIAKIGIFFTVLLEGKELGKVRREVVVAVSARLIEHSSNKLLWSKIFKAKKGGIM